MKALSIKQPWAWLIVNGHKDIENRDWFTKFHGPVLIHAGKTLDDWAIVKTKFGLRLTPWFREWLAERQLGAALLGLDILKRPSFEFPAGGIVGMATIADCVTDSKSPWFVGDYGFLLKDAKVLPFVPLRGQLGFFDVPDEVIKQLGMEG